MEISFPVELVWRAAEIEGVFDNRRLVIPDREFRDESGAGLRTHWWAHDSPMNLLDVRGLNSFYGDFQALFSVDFHVSPGEAVALVGANGAGKTTLLKSIVGLIAKRHGAMRFAGKDIAGEPAERIAQQGISLVPEGHLLFPSLTVEENLLMGAVVRRPGFWTLDKVYDLFPALKRRARNKSTDLSGGEQQMVAIGRALMSNPKLLLCDEISLGLAPVIVEQIYRCLPVIREEGTAIVLVEQDVGRAVAVVDRIYCLLKGRVTLQDRASDVSLDDLSRAYFGT